MEMRMAGGRPWEMLRNKQPELCNGFIVRKERAGGGSENERV
jgi:hypothetical protein